MKQFSEEDLKKIDKIISDFSEVPHENVFSDHVQLAYQYLREENKKLTNLGLSMGVIKNKDQEITLLKEKVAYLESYFTLEAHEDMKNVKAMKSENDKLRKALTKIYAETQSETAWEALK